MIKVVYSFTTTLPVEKAFFFIADQFFDNLQIWNAALQNVEKLTAGEVKIGTRGHEVQLIQGKPYERTFEVIAYEKHRVFGIKSIPAGKPKEHYQSSFTFAEERNMTHIAFHFELEMYSVGFRFFQAFIQRTIERDVMKNMENLKEYLNKEAI